MNNKIPMTLLSGKRKEVTCDATGKICWICLWKYFWFLAWKWFLSFDESSKSHSKMMSNSFICWLVIMRIPMRRRIYSERLEYWNSKETYIIISTLSAVNLHLHLQRQMLVLSTFNEMCEISKNQKLKRHFLYHFAIQFSVLSALFSISSLVDRSRSRRVQTPQVASKTKKTKKTTQTQKKVKKITFTSIVLVVTVIDGNFKNFPAKENLRKVLMKNQKIEISSMTATRKKLQAKQS